MNAYKTKAELGKDGTLLLEGLPFSSGQWVEVIVLDVEEPVTTHETTVQRSVTSPQDTDYLTAVSATLTEWQSEADEIAYRDL